MGTPRRAPMLVLVHLLAGSGPAQAAWVVLALALLFAGFGNGAARTWDAWLFRGPVAHVPGEITRTDRRGHKHRYVAIEFRLAGGDDLPRAGVAYASAPPALGPATLEYPVGRPDLVRPVGARLSPYSPEAAKVSAAIVVGLALALLVRVLRGVPRTWHLLRRGTAVRAARRRDQPRLTVEYRVGGERHRVVTDAAVPGAALDAELDVLHEPARPAVAIVVDALPGRPALDDGAIVLRAPTPRLLLYPLAAVLAAVAGFVLLVTG